MNAISVHNENSLDAFKELLKESKLPYQDLRLKDSVLIQYEGQPGKIIGSGGIEFYPPYALMRSIAVVSALRGRSHGREIVNDLLKRARGKASEVYLLTGTARDFFLHIGFSDIARDQVPEKIKVSSEFSAVCPASAACMVYRF